MKKIFFLFTICCIVVLNLHAQLTTEEQPYSWNANIAAKLQKIDNIILTAPDLTRIQEEDLENDKQPGPVRYAYPVQVNYTLENSGVWQQLDDGSKIWQLKVSIPGALSTNTYYEKFWLPEGAKFFIYNEETRQYIGAITSDFIGGSQNKPIKFATSLIYGKNVVYEYFQPSYVNEIPKISISHIDYGYRYIDNPYGYTPEKFGDGDTCNININCPEGSNWQTEKHAVARVNVVGPGISGWCTCTLINNTKNDFTPYVLTANHCLKGLGLDATINNDASQWTFYWEYENPECIDSKIEPTPRSTTGAVLVANNSVTDFALLLLDTKQNPHNLQGVSPYYLGWDRTGNEAASGVGIHHPKGDVKKMATTNQILNFPSELDWKDGNISPPNTHWLAIFSKGFIEGGSSGSPLINNSGRIVGQLHGSEEKKYVEKIL